MQINYYIFTENEPIHIELDFKRGMVRIDKKWLSMESMEKQLNDFIKSLERYKKISQGKNK